MVEEILHNGVMLALIVRGSYKSEGIHFLTPEVFSQQLGYMNRPKGYVVPPHDHTPIPRTIEWTQEVLFVRRGKVRLDVYACTSREYLESRILSEGDVVLLAHGGHGLVMLEQSELIEVKQGPYAGERDKTRFVPVSEGQIRVKG